MGTITFLIILFNIAFSDFFKAIKKPFERKKIGYAGKIKADIFKYIEPYAITSKLEEKNFGTMSALKYTRTPEITLNTNRILLMYNMIVQLAYNI